MSHALPEDGAPVTPAAIPAGFKPLSTTQGFALQIGPLFQKLEADGAYVRAFRVGPQHTNGMNNAHGGMLMAFADMAFGHVISVRHRQWWITVRLLCDFVGPAQVGAWVEGQGEILGVRGDLYTVRGRIWVGDRTIMTGDGLFKAVARRD